jgi:hypothetical protein
MFTVEASFNDGTDKEMQFKTFQGACQWLMYQRGIESALIEKCVAAPILDLEDEPENLLSKG